jgi:branched-chain amino acid transport system substrate-binding protein
MRMRQSGLLAAIAAAIAGGLAMAVAVAGPAAAQDKLKIGLITTLSSPAATAGPEMLDGFRLGIKDSGDALGGRKIELVVGDDQLKPDVAVNIARKMLDEDRVQLIAGIIPSNVLLAVAHTVLPRKIPLLSLNAGASQLAGAECSPYFFNVSYQNDQAAEAMALHLQKKGVKNAYLVAANYAAGRDMTSGFKRVFKGDIVGETYTPLNQFDFVAEMAEIRAAKPDSVFFFEQSGAPVINFVKQFAEAGLKGRIPLYGVSFVLDEASLPGMGDAAIGVKSAGYWSASLDIRASREFVAHFTAEYHRRPSIFAAVAYDGSRLIDAALRAVDGDIERRDDFLKALAKADFASVRGRFRFNTNHYPIQSFYLSEVERDASGAIVDGYRERIVEDYADSYVGQCKMR